MTNIRIDYRPMPTEVGSGLINRRQSMLRDIRECAEGYSVAGSEEERKEYTQRVEDIIGNCMPIEADQFRAIFDRLREPSTTIGSEQ